MGNSTTTLQQAYDYAKAKGIPVPTDQPGGYGSRLAIKMGNDVLSAIIAERFNWKWNRAIAAPFLTNSYQQDYPQIGLVNVGWLEEADKVDINNTAIPKPLNVPGMTVVRQLSRTSLCLWPVNQMCWMYNQELSYGTWPGPGVTFNAQLAPSIIQNPIMSMKDANGNLLIVTTLGTTVKGPAPAALTPTYAQGIGGGLVILYVAGTTPPGWLQTGINVSVTVSDLTLQPGTPVQVTGVATGYSIGGNPYYGFSYVLPGAPTVAQEAVTASAQQYVGAPLLVNGAAEGSTFNDGTVVWTVVAPMSQGFRVYPLPGATGPVYQITPYYQMLLQKMTALGSLINPIPDDYSYLFQRGLEISCRQASANPNDRAEGMKDWPLWLAAMVEMRKQGNREVDSYGVYPADSVVDSVYGPWRGLRNPQDPGQPY